MKPLHLLATSALSLAMVGGCSVPTSDTNKILSFQDSFTVDNTTAWEKGNWANGGMFNCGWLPENVSVKDGKMTLTLNDKASHSKNFSGGEYRTKNTFSYGTFEVRMKPAQCNGIVSSFFTYTNKPQWDEIDIEFLGKDTTKVQFNYFVNGVGNHEYIYDLGFNASDSFHTYAFKWDQKSISWYVDGIKVHTAMGTIPTHEMQIMMNLWNGTGVDSWLNAFSYPGVPLHVEYEYVKFYTTE